MKKLKVVLLSGLLVLNLVSCTFTPNEAIYDSLSFPEIEIGPEIHDIFVVAPFEILDAASDAELAEISVMVQGAQEYFDNTELTLGLETIYFAPLRGEYFHGRQEMMIMGAFVNRLSTPISTLAGEVRMQVDAPNVQIATSNVSFPAEFIGVLQPNEALLISFTAPVRGLYEDQIFEAFQFKAEINDIIVTIYE